MRAQPAISKRFPIRCLSALFVAVLAAAAPAQTVTGDGALGTVRRADLINDGITLKDVSGPGALYNIGGYGTVPLFVAVSGYYIGPPVDIQLQVNPSYFGASTMAGAQDQSNFSINDYAVFTPTDAMGMTTGNATYLPVSAHVVAPVLGYDAAAVDALSKKTIAYGQSVTVPLHLFNASNALDVGSNTLGHKADLTVARPVEVQGISGYKRSDGVTAFDTNNAEVTVNGPATGPDIVLAPHDANDDYSITITPVRDTTRNLRLAEVRLQSDLNSSLGALGTTATDVRYFVPDVVADHTTQTVVALGGAGDIGGGAGSTGGVTGSFTSGTGGDFAVDYSVGAALPATPNFQVAGGSGMAQQWEISYTGTIDPAGGPVTLKFEFDASLLTDAERMNVLIEHYVNGAYEALPIIDRGYNTITVTTTSFSPFVLGTAVPEPATLSLAVCAGSMVVRRRRAQPILTEEK